MFPSRFYQSAAFKKSIRSEFGAFYTFNMANCRLLRVDPTLQRWLWMMALQSVQAASCVAVKVQLLQWEKRKSRWWFFFEPLLTVSLFWWEDVGFLLMALTACKNWRFLASFALAAGWGKGVCTGGSGFSFVFKPWSVNMNIMNWLLTQVVLFASKALRYLNLNKQISKEAMWDRSSNSIQTVL